VKLLAFQAQMEALWGRRRTERKRDVHRKPLARGDLNAKLSTLRRSGRRPDDHLPPRRIRRQSKLELRCG